MWSVYDTMILLSGVITAAIALAPVAGIPQKTRLLSGLIGGGLILLALYLGSLTSFTYPGIVWVGPLFALFAGGVIVSQALKQGRPGAGDLQQDEQAHSVASRPAPATLSSASPQAPQPAVASVAADPRTDAWVEVHDPSTSAARLATIAAEHPEFGSTILAHPNVYPDLRSWIEQHATNSPDR